MTSRCTGRSLLVFVALLVPILSACPDDPPPTADTGVPDAQPTTCPTHIEFENESTRRDIGWTGVTHSTTVSAGARFTAIVEGCDSECRNCRFAGLAPNSGVNNRRCLADPRIECTSDSDCPEDRCRFMYGPPLTIFTSPGRAVCIGGGFEPLANGDPGLSGTIDLATGDMTIDHFNIGGTWNSDPDTGEGGACPTCIGDTIPNDGTETVGRCAISPGDSPGPVGNEGADCDVNGFGGPVSQPSNSFYSFDCVSAVQVPTPNVEDWAPFTTRGTRWVLDASRPMCTAEAFSDQPCWCGYCENSETPCANDRECPAGSACGWFPDDGMHNGKNLVRTQPNGCVDQACDWDPETAIGTCESAVVPFTGSTVGCFPGEAGAEITASGSAVIRDGVYLVQLASIRCSPPTPDTDFVVGNPGASLSRLAFTVTPLFR